MSDIRSIALILITGSAMLDDLSRGRISNGIIMTGLLWGALYQSFSGGMTGLLIFLGGVLLPVILMSGLYYFRMIGAGDIKLFSVIGGFLGPMTVLSCMVISVLLGGLISLTIMICHHNFSQRFIYFSEYIYNYSKDKKWNPYMARVDVNAKFCFSVPVLFSVLWYMAG